MDRGDRALRGRGCPALQVVLSPQPPISVICAVCTDLLRACSSSLRSARPYLFQLLAAPAPFSAAELLSDEAAGTGCGYDSALVWARDVCVLNDNADDDSVSAR